MHIILFFILLLGGSAGGEPGWHQAILAQSGAQIQAETNTVKANSDSRTIRTNAEVYRAIKGEYPTVSQLMNPGKEVPEAEMGDSLKAKITTANPTKETPEKIQYRRCSRSGGEVAYYDSIQKKVVRKSLGSGCGA